MTRFLLQAEVKWKECQHLLSLLPTDPHSGHKGGGAAWLATTDELSRDPVLTELIELVFKRIWWNSGSCVHKHHIKKNRVIAAFQAVFFSLFKGRVSPFFPLTRTAHKDSSDTLHPRQMKVLKCEWKQQCSEWHLLAANSEIRALQFMEIKCQALNI